MLDSNPISKKIHMAKGHGKGGYLGDLINGAGQIVYCLGFMMVVGPFLILGGILTFNASFSNTRAELINEYNTEVAKWNSGLGTSGTFENLNIAAKFSSLAGSTTVLLGKTAPELLGDADEKFMAIDKPVSYCLNLCFIHMGDQAPTLLLQQERQQSLLYLF